MKTMLPITDVVSTIWSTLAQGADDQAHPLHLLTLASVGPDGRPSARLMVNRGVDPDAACLWFHTDIRSPKVAELRASPFACVVGYDTGSCSQIQLAGSAKIHQSGTLAASHWDHYSRSAAWLYGSAAPVAPGAAPDLFLPPDRESLAHAITARARAHFAVIELEVETIEWLQVIAEQQRRATLRRGTGWKPEGDA